MRPIAIEEIIGLAHYGELRADYRKAVIAHKKLRRLAVGEKVTLLFEDRETLRFQIQEMCWVERITDPTRVQDEVDVYNELVPGARELSATLMVEITEASRVRAELDRLVGIDEHVALVLGDGTDAETLRADFDAKQLEEDRISAVQYIRFRLSPAQAQRLEAPDVAARVRIDHPNYARDREIPPAVRASLVATLTHDPEPLLRVEPAQSVRRPRDEVLFETDRVRALRPARPHAPGHVVVEARSAEASFLDADPDLLLALLEGVRRAAAEIVREHGACRVQIDLQAGARGLRWHLHPPRR